MFHKRFKRILPVMALAGALMFIMSVVMEVMGTGHQQAFIVDSSQARSLVEEALVKLDTLQPVSVDDKSLKDAIGQVRKAAYVNTVWLFAPDGRIVNSRGSMSDSTASCGTIMKAATIDTHGVLDSMPQGALNHEQKTMLLAASAIRREGTHNDIYRHLIHPVRKADGSLAALVGVAYEVDGGSHGSGMDLMFGALMRLGGFVVYWLALPLWVLLDARERKVRAGVWVAFVLIGNLVAFIAYLLSRPAVSDSATRIDAATG